MGLARFSIHKYVRIPKRWRYCKPIYGKKNKLKPNAILMAGKEALYPEGNYYPNVDGGWEKVGVTAVMAPEAQTKRLARQRYQCDAVERFPEP